MPVNLHTRTMTVVWIVAKGIGPPIDLLGTYEAVAILASACNPMVSNPRKNGPEMLTVHSGARHALLAELCGKAHQQFPSIRLDLLSAQR